MEARKDGLPVGVRPLQIFGGANRQPVPLGPYIIKEMLMFAGPPKVNWYWSSIGANGAMCGSTENKRRYEARVEDLTHLGPKARRTFVCAG